MHLYNFSLLRFHEFGILKKMDEMIHPLPIKEIEKDSFHSIEIEQMIQVLVLPIFGVLLAMIILIGEIVITRWKRNKERNNRWGQIK